MLLSILRTVLEWSVYVHTSSSSLPSDADSLSSIQLVANLNLPSDDCFDEDEISQTAGLARALGSAQQVSLDGLEGQSHELARDDFVSWEPNAIDALGPKRLV